MRIGELSKATGVSIRSLRYYEEQGLISSQRMANGYRDYHSFSAEQVKTIQFYLSLGLTTEQIAGFLHCVMTSKEAFCREIMPVYRSKLKEVSEQIELLQAIKANLEERISHILSENPEMEMNENGNETDQT
ncbi:MAG: MerR family transcriptional regulator [Paenibacillaceae bacterium]|uniref:MerR family transcriptional regulator n=1 Tax=Paenibacillus mellifer TaxID=2937794 RepID=A0A9X2BP55_9BACL|nr:MerR family transcriptional regulator [Paenibacillus mellifer]MBW4840184.1 MerR family transcriptional regulator [Paenibacillaceae bacterium]MCK8486753.1 MerR family transcriptional regulator [Paenibacillus mellifer]